MLVRTVLLIAAAASAAEAVGQQRTALRPGLDAVTVAPPLPAHAEAFEFTLPEPPPGDRSVRDLAAGLRDPHARGACLAGLVRLDLDTLRRSGRDLPAAGLKQLLTDPGTDADIADASGLLYGLTGAADGPKTLSGAVLDRAKRGEHAAGCVLGLLLCGGEPALDWLGKLCARPGCPAGFTLSALAAADVALREPAVGLDESSLHGFAARLLDSDAAASFAADRLTRWRAWRQAGAVFAAAARVGDPDRDRARGLQLAAARFAMRCASDPAAGAAGRACRGWLAEKRTTDPDLLRRAERTAGR